MRDLSTKINSNLRWSIPIVLLFLTRYWKYGQFHPSFMSTLSAIFAWSPIDCNNWHPLYEKVSLCERCCSFNRLNNLTRQIDFTCLLLDRRQVVIDAVSGNNASFFDEFFVIFCTALHESQTRLAPFIALVLHLLSVNSLLVDLLVVFPCCFQSSAEIS